MAFYTRTDEAGTLIWSSYSEKPGALAPGEIECTVAEYNAGHSQVWSAKPASDSQASTSPAEGGNADTPA